jgi:hypothetical protein
MSDSNALQNARDIAEVGGAIFAARSHIETLFIRGLATAKASDVKALSQHAEQWAALGAVHVATRLQAMIVGVNGNAASAPKMLLDVFTSLGVLERVMSNDVAQQAFAQWPADAVAQTDTAVEDEAADEDVEPAVATVAAKGNKRTAKPSKSAGKGTGKASKAVSSSAVDSAGPGKVRTIREFDAVVSNLNQATSASAPGVDDKATMSMADELIRAIEELVRTGLVSATEATRAKLDATFKEASRNKLQRIGASLRYVNEEVGRYLADDGTFSPRRFGLFLHRSWLLARGFVHALREKNRNLAQRLAMGSGAAVRSVKRIELVTLGVWKRVVSTACTFDFKLRVVAGEPDLIGRSVTWSFVFARKADAANVPAEAYLHLPQPQKYVPSMLIDRNVIIVENAALTFDERDNARIALGPPSTVAAGPAFEKWESLYQWNVAAVHANSAVSPLDLAVEAQQEVMFDAWRIAADAERSNEERRVFAIEVGTQSAGATLRFDGIVATGADGEELTAALATASESAMPQMPLYGVSYAEYGRMLMLPLSYLTAHGPKHLMWSKDHIDVAALMKTLTM